MGAKEAAAAAFPEPKGAGGGGGAFLDMDVDDAVDGERPTGDGPVCRCWATSLAEGLRWEIRSQDA